MTEPENEFDTIAAEHRAFEEAYKTALAADPAPISPRLTNGARVVWSPQEGSQVDGMACPLFELLTHGPRGGGKTDGLLMQFAQHVGRGYGPAWRGIIFRNTFPQLGDLVAKAEKWFRQIFPEARFNRSSPLKWVWPTGEVLYLAHINHPNDYWNYHGWELPFIGWEELTNWPTDECYKAMMSCCRSSDRRVPRIVRATTNPYGVGHGWIKQRFRLAGQWWKTVIVTDSKNERGQLEPARCALFSHTAENKVLREADPDYMGKVLASARNSAQAEAWELGTWDFVAGGMFGDVWSPAHNIVPDFVVPPTWRIDRSFDWGSSKPFSVGWWAVSDGSDVVLRNGKRVSTVRGDLFRMREWYGWTGRPNEGLRMLATDIAKGIIERETMFGWRTPQGTRVRPGPADSAIFTVENGSSIAVDMERPVRIGPNVFPGISWVPANKAPGTRRTGWELVRRMMRDAHRVAGRPREVPGLFVVGDYCPQFLRTMLVLPRDENNLDDVNTKAEDHTADEVRYRVLATGAILRTGTTSVY